MRFQECNNTFKNFIAIYSLINYGKKEISKKQKMISSVKRCEGTERGRKIYIYII